MTRRFDFNIFSLSAIALAITVFISLFTGIPTKNSPSSSDTPYSHNLEKSSSGSYLNLLVAESEEDTSLKVRTNHYSPPSNPSPITYPQPEPSQPKPSSKPTVAVQPTSPPQTPEPTSTPTETKNPDETLENPEDTKSIDDTLIPEFKARNEKISTLLDQLNTSLDRLYLEKIIYQPELDVLYPTLSELDQLLALESDFVSAHSDSLPAFYHQRHESNLSAFSALRDRLDYLLANLQPLSEDINTYTYASFCDSLSTSTPEETTPADPEPSDGSNDPNGVASTSDITDDPTSSDPILDSFGFPVCFDTSYVAEKAFDFYSLSLSDWGNSSSWRESALALGLTVDDSPSIHSIGIDLSNDSSPHVVWVENLGSSAESTPSPSPLSSPTPSASPTPTLSSDSVVPSTPTPTASPIPTPTPDTAASSPSVFINLSEYDSILTSKNFSYRAKVSSSSYIFIHLDSLPKDSDSSQPSE